MRVDLAGGEWWPVLRAEKYDEVREGGVEVPDELVEDLWRAQRRAREAENALLRFLYERDPTELPSPYDQWVAEDGWKPQDEKAHAMKRAPEEILARMRRLLDEYDEKLVGIGEFVDVMNALVMEFDQATSDG